MENVAADLEERLKAETNPDTKRQIEREMAGMKRRRETEEKRHPERRAPKPPPV